MPNCWKTGSIGFHIWCTQSWTSDSIIIISSSSGIGSGSACGSGSDGGGSDGGGSGSGSSSKSSILHTTLKLSAL